MRLPVSMHHDARHAWRALAVAASVCMIVAAGGCGKKTVGPETGGETLFQYLPPTAPQNVLRNLVSAYAKRDSVQSAAVYDSAYQGISTDPNAPVPIPDFTRADEIHHVGALKLNPNIVTVFIDFGSPANWQRLPANASDPADWAVIPIISSIIRIEDVGRATTWESRNDVMEFTFKPTVSAPGDTTWTVVRWVEIAN